MSLLALLKIHKNTRRFYILLQSFWQAENGNQVVLITAKNAAKKPKTYSEPARPARCRRAPGLQPEVSARPRYGIGSHHFRLSGALRHDDGQSSSSCGRFCTNHQALCGSSSGGASAQDKPAWRCPH